MKAASLPCAISLVLISAAEAAAEAPRMRVMLGLRGPVEQVSEGGKGVSIQVELGRSPTLGVGLTQRLAGPVAAVLDVAVAPMHAYTFSACYFTGRACDFPSADRSDAQTYSYVLGVEVGQRSRRVNPFLALEGGGVTYAHVRFGHRYDTRFLWSIRGGVLIRAGRHGVVVEARRSTVGNPPWGLESFHPYDIRAGVDLTF